MTLRAFCLLLLMLGLTACHPGPWPVEAVGRIEQRTFYKHTGDERSVYVLMVESAAGAAIVQPGHTIPLTHRGGKIWNKSTLHAGDRVQVYGKIHLNAMRDTDGKILGDARFLDWNDDYQEQLHLRIDSIRKLPAEPATQPTSP